MVEDLVGIELAYINTKHPDFHEAGLIHKALTSGDYIITTNPTPIQNASNKSQRDISRGKENRVSSTKKKKIILLFEYLFFFRFFPIE